MKKSSHIEESSSPWRKDANFRFVLVISMKIVIQNDFQYIMCDEQTLEQRNRERYVWILSHF